MTLLLRLHPKAMGTYVLTLDGSIDGQTASLLQHKLDQLVAERPALITLDMAKVTYVSSAGLRVILKTQRALNDIKGKLVFMHLQPQVRKVFDIIKALPSMRVFRDLGEMDAYLNRIQRRSGAGSEPKQ